MDNEKITLALFQPRNSFSTCYFKCFVYYYDEVPRVPHMGYSLYILNEHIVNVTGVFLKKRKKEM